MTGGNHEGLDADFTTTHHDRSVRALPADDFPGFLLGLGASFMTAYKLWLTVSAKEKKKSETEPPAFNLHK